MPSARLPRLLTVATAVILAATACGDRPDPPASAPQFASASPAPSSASPAPSPSPSTPPAGAAPVAIPAGVTAGIVVYDREASAFVLQQKGDWRFRSASLVKLLIALDYFWDRGPDYSVPGPDQPKLQIMLRSSDDAAATGLWKADGQREIVNRMVKRLGLHDTEPPPVSQPGYWGYTAVSAGDLVRVYQYILDRAPAAEREFIMGNLHQTTKCGTDHYDQSFGIPSVFKAPRAAKQGWSGFGDNPATPCVATAGYPGTSGAFVPAAAPNKPDMMGEVLHTTGTVGEHDRYIVAVLSVHPDGSQFARAAANLTRIVRALPLPDSTKLV
ncbi:hypothetical protein Dvina_41720 [Dactylosporangium vinaceum]|uniref:Lipoprotein n=1 Tax=Dactylosporangium vinaceum TaxID=53362 RepID=A0ABV5M8L8_9ACTN|nr:hypothetical protein [Dactylosporangium vinaceum]UAB94586.1 hypothetical protein Dvina_41720 [Dactylosporangium vinaceum]